MNETTSLSAPEYQDEERPEVRQGWRIGSLGEADWALARLGEYEAQVGAVDAQARAAIDRIEKRAAELKAAALRGRAFFEAALAEYAHRERHELLGGGRKKSRDLIHGTLGFRTKRGGLVVVDEAAALEWAKAQPVEDELVRVEVKLSRSALQELHASTGVVPPGCEVRPDEETFYVRAAAPELALVKENP